MDEAAGFHLEDDGRRAVLTGDWTAVRLGDAADELADAVRGDREPDPRPDRDRPLRHLRRLERPARHQGQGRSDSIVASPELKRLLDHGREGDRGRADASPSTPAGPRPLRPHRPRGGRRRRQHLRHHGLQRPPADGGRPGDRELAADPLGGGVLPGRAGGAGRHPHRRHHHLLHRRGGRPAGRQPAGPVRRPGVRRGADRHRGAARVQRADHRPAAGRPLGLVLRRRDRGDEDEPGDRRHAGAGRRSVRRPGLPALRRPASDHPPADLHRHPRRPVRRHGGGGLGAGPLADRLLPAPDRQRGHRPLLGRAVQGAR